MEENNKLISDFMGITNMESGQWSITEQMNNGYYHKSWNWLMPIIEKIEIDAIVVITGNNCEIYTLKNDDYDFMSNYNIKNNNYSKIESTYLAVIEFIKWYNKNNR
jgi:hypothetical protein